MTYPNLSKVELINLLGTNRNTTFKALKTAKVRGLYIGTVSPYIDTVSIKIDTIAPVSILIRFVSKLIRFVSI